MNAPKKPHRPSEPKKPEKSYTTSRQKDIDLYDGTKFKDLLSNIAKLGISHDSLYFRVESTGSSYGDTEMRLSYDEPQVITLKDAYFDKLMRGYERKMEVYRQKLAKYEFLAANYEKDYETWRKRTEEERRQRDIKEFERLKKALKL